MKKLFFVILTGITLIVAISLMSTAQAKTKYLKEEEIKTTMADFGKALGVKCDFCHVKDRSQDYQDLAGQTADKDQLAALVHKRIAGSMMGTMLYLNQKEGKNYTCNTCHQGKREVEMK